MRESVHGRMKGQTGKYWGKPSLTKEKLLSTNFVHLVA